MKFFKKLWSLILAFDLWILDKCQKFSDWITKRIGIGFVNYKFANALITAYTCFSIIAIIYAKFNIALSCIFIIGGISMKIVLLLDINEEKREIHSENPTRKNSQTYYIYRILTLGIAGMPTVYVIIYAIYKSMPSSTKYSAIFFLISYYSVMLFLYLISCSSLPPQKDKIKNWIKGLFRMNKPVPSKIPTN